MWEVGSIESVIRLGYASICLIDSTNEVIEEVRKLHPVLNVFIKDLSEDADLHQDRRYNCAYIFPEKSEKYESYRNLPDTFVLM